MAMSIWRCHILADTPICHPLLDLLITQITQKPIKYEKKLTMDAFMFTFILISEPCPTIVQWDTINYNQAPLMGLNQPPPQ